ncbi:MAG: hypothetical protein C5B58_05035, partial [Acidobacteria bacterium]
GAAAVPTTRHVWEAASGRPPQGRIAGTATELAHGQPFFHWPIEVPEVFAAGGFDVMLGNPPWERIKLVEKEFFATRDRAIAEAPNKAAREHLIKALSAPDASEAKRSLARDWAAAKHSAECESKFLRESARYPLTAVGDINTYAVFAETFLKCISSIGRAGFIVPTGITTDDATSKFFSTLVGDRRLASVFDFENRAHIFSALHTKTKFCLLTLAGSQVSQTLLSFMATATESLSDARKVLRLTPEEIRLTNPNSATLTIFRSRADAELTLAIYRRVPVLIKQGPASEGNTWGLRFARLFDMTNDAPLFSVKSDSSKVPLYEAKMFWHFDHRWSSFEDGESVAPTEEQKKSASFQALPRYWISRAEATRRLADMSWNRLWLLACRNISDSRNERTFVASILPFCALGNSGSALFIDPKLLDKLPLLIANLNSLVFDYVAKQKIPGTNINYFMIEQLPALPPSAYSSRDINFIKPRVVELVYTAEDLKAFAVDFGFAAMTPSWNPQRRERIRAELDAYYAYLYGLTRRELEYVLDPKGVMGEDYPSESFRVLEENELRKFQEYRTKRLVLEAWDRFAADGTFDAARLREPQYIDRVAQELTATRAKLEQVEYDSKALLKLASATPKPTLFVEGITDAKIFEAAWAVFFPSEPMPVKVIAAGGTKEMGSLAGKGKALREVLGEQVVLVLADNDSAGRQLTEDGHVRKGGTWRRLPNGIHWCLLKPTATFAAAMKAHNVPPDYWPFTIEAAFPPALRRQAETAGAWRFSDKPQAELLTNAELAGRLFALKLGPEDDAYWYLMAPHPEAKDAFAAWVTDPKRCTDENYAAFEEIVRGLRALLARGNDSETTTRLRGAA